MSKENNTAVLTTAFNVIERVMTKVTSDPRLNAVSPSGNIRDYNTLTKSVLVNTVRAKLRNIVAQAEK